jgi:hypothetical protein
MNMAGTLLRRGRAGKSADAAVVAYHRDIGALAALQHPKSN